MSDYRFWRKQVKRGDADFFIILTEYDVNSARSLVPRNSRRMSSIQRFQVRAVR